MADSNAVETVVLLILIESKLILLISNVDKSNTAFNASKMCFTSDVLTHILLA
jgi:hypothetical protein